MRVFIMKRISLIKGVLITAAVCAAVICAFCFSGGASTAFSDSSLCITRIAGAENSVALTFDTSFEGDCTEEILKVLKDKGAKGTFAVMGLWAEKNLKTANDIVSSGNEVISHSMMHENYDGLGNEAALEDAASAKKLLKMELGVETDHIRLPYGAGNDSTLKNLIENGFKPVGWSVDAEDWRGDGAENVVNRVLSKAESGSVIVMQCGRDALKALPDIIDGLYEKNLECVTLSKMEEEDVH